MSRKREELTLKIQKLQQAIKKKYKQFKYGVVESEEKLEQQFKPLITELRKKGPEIKIEPKEEEEEYTFKPKASSSPARPSMFEDEAASNTQGHESVTKYINVVFPNKLTNEYMRKMIGPESNSLDHMFGPRYEGSALMVGNKLLEFDDDGRIVIGDIKYTPTRGLYELLFKSMPSDEVYDDQDLSAYKDILIRTNAHKKDYKFTGKINRNNSRKYRYVIENLFPKSGRGWKNTDEKDISRWDDPNELVDRLRHLIASTETGNHGHVNEIINIIEELKEAKYISGRGNRRFLSLLK